MKTKNLTLIVMATLKLHALNVIGNGMVVDYHLAAIAKDSGLDIEEVRKIRDIVQAITLLSQPKPVLDKPTKG